MLGMGGMGGVIRIPGPMLINFVVTVQQCLPVVSLLVPLF